MVNYIEPFSNYLAYSNLTHQETQEEQPEPEPEPISYKKLRINGLATLGNNFFYQNGGDNNIPSNSVHNASMHLYIWINADNTTSSLGRANSATLRTGSWSNGYITTSKIILAFEDYPHSNYSNVNWKITNTNPSSDFIEIEYKDGSYFNGNEVVQVWLDEARVGPPDYNYNSRNKSPYPGSNGTFTPGSSFITFIEPVDELATVKFKILNFDIKINQISIIILVLILVLIITIIYIKSL